MTTLMGKRMRCAYCNRIHPFDHDHFPSRAYAQCWWCWRKDNPPKPLGGRRARVLIWLHLRPKATWDGPHAHWPNAHTRNWKCVCGRNWENAAHGGTENPL